MAFVMAFVLSATATSSLAQQTPGLSPTLSASPPYVCLTNYYVDGTKGNDSNPGTQAKPWKTIQNASDGYPNVPKPGECVNVLPGTYKFTSTMVLSVGGDSNTPTGYIVYRSTVPQGAHIIAESGINNGDLIALWVPYIIIDGFQIDGNHSLTSGTGINGCTGGGGPSNIAHHIIVINNVIHDMGGAGLSTCTADYIDWSHNVIYNTSSTNQYQVSGIDIWQPKALVKGSYTPTAADNQPFTIMVEYNIVHDNSEGPAIAGNHTDGNGIIIDTTYGSATCRTCGTPYPGQILVLGNVSYNNGGGGIHVFLSENVTVANNTVYRNYQDPLNQGTTRGDLSNGASANINWINNIAIAVPGSGFLATNGPIVSFPLAGFPDSGTWTKNIADGGPVTSDTTSYVNPSTNLIGINPMLESPASGQFQPLPGSPAIGTGQPESYVPSSTPDIGAY
jgi:parallel beta-helix repeat protein